MKLCIEDRFIYWWEGGLKRLLIARGLLDFSKGHAVPPGDISNQSRIFILSQLGQSLREDFQLSKVEPSITLNSGTNENVNASFVVMTESGAPLNEKVLVYKL